MQGERKEQDNTAILNARVFEPTRVATMVANGAFMPTNDHNKAIYAAEQNRTIGGAHVGPRTKDKDKTANSTSGDKQLAASALGSLLQECQQVQ